MSSIPTVLSDLTASVGGAAPFSNSTTAEKLPRTDCLCRPGGLPN